MAKVVVTTADCVEDTGRISFKFLFDADVRGKLGYIPSAWGWVWRKTEGCDKDVSYSINVFANGGLVMGGGWNEFSEWRRHNMDDEEKERMENWDKEMLGEIPDCCLLMDGTTFEWWKEFAAKHGFEYEHIHHNGSLKTS